MATSVCLDDDTLDQQLARDHAEIDQMFTEPSSGEDVKSRSNIRQSTSQSRDIKQFLESCENLDIKMGQVKLRLEQISESDLGLRVDLVEMETQQIEAEVATTISRGETLILMIKDSSNRFFE